VVPEQTGLIGQLVAGSPVPIALGERLFARHEFLPPLQAGVAVVQPDLSHAGGISETRRIASLAEVFGALLAPHCPLGPIALAACLQVDFATPNFLIQEQSAGIHYNTENSRNGENGLLDYLVDPTVFRFVAGHIERPTGPGLGITVDEAAVREAARRGHRWRSPIWRYEDGSLAEW
jgi:galactonate dehydratase